MASLEIALWDLIGKATQQPVYKLWGAHKDRVPAYASMIRLSTPEESAFAWRSQLQVGRLEGHQASPALPDDARGYPPGGGRAQGRGRRYGDHDGRQPGAIGTGWQPGVMWDFRRALETARELRKAECVVVGRTAAAL